MKNFVAIDIETCWLDPKRAFVIKIMATKVKDGVYEKFTTFVKLGKKLSPLMIEITGITNEDLRHAPKMKEIIGELTRFCEGLPLVAYNAPFVQKVIKHPAFADITDIIEVARNLFGCKVIRLKKLAEFLEVPYDEKDESETLAKLYIRIMDFGYEEMKREIEISRKAGGFIGTLYNAILKQYNDPTNPETILSLNILCARIVFCLYAEASDSFEKFAFRDYIKKVPLEYVRQALKELFKVLDTKENDRDPYLCDELKAFPYIKSRLFAKEDIEIPNFNEEIITLLLSEAIKNLDLSETSLAVFNRFAKTN